MSNSPKSFPSSQSISSAMYSNEAGDKDDLIDHLQEKAAELLTVQQELCTVKNENEVIKSKLSANERALAAEREKNLTNEKLFNSENQHLQETINNLTKESEQKTQTINSLMVELQSFRQSLQEVAQDSSDNQLQSQMQVQTGQLQTALQEKESVIERLDQQIQELKTTNTDLQNQLSQVQTANQQNQFTLDNKKEDIQKLEQEKADLVSSQQKMNDEIEKYKQIIEQQQQQILELTLTNKNNTEKIEALTQEKAKYEAQIEDSNKELVKIQKCFSSCDNSDDILNAVAAYKNTIKDMKQKSKKDKKKIKACKEVLVQQQNLIEKKDSYIKQMQETNNNCVNEIENTKNKLQRLETVISNFDDSKKCANVIIKANEELTQQFNELKKALIPEFSIPSFRTIILSVIITKRWKEVVGTKKEIVTDSRNWWWLRQNQKSTKDAILSKIEQIINTSNQLQQINQQHEELTKENQDTIKQANQIIADKEGQIIVEREKLDDANIKNKQLQEKMKNMVEITVYQKLEQKYKQTKDKFENCIQIMHENEEIIANLRSRLAVSEDKRDKNGISANAAAIEIKNLQRQLRDANHEIEILNQALNGKRKEILSLERGIFSEQRSKAALASQCYNLASENQNLTRANNIVNDAPRHKRVDENTLNSKLREMSRNMTGTLF